MDWELLHKYLSEESTAEEKAQVDAWLQEDHEHRHLLYSLSKIWEVNPKDEIQVDSQSAWDSFQGKISTEKEHSRARDHSTSDIKKLDPHQNRKIGQWLPVTALALVVLLIGFFMHSFWNSEVKQKPNIDEDPHVVITKRGQRTLFRLPDGSRIHLNAASKIEIPASFGDSLRRVNLEGEAYFDVAHNPQKPFVVHSRNTYTKVLGTKFGIKAYPDDSEIEVAVEEGRVALEAFHLPTNESMQITKNRLGLLSESGHVRKVEISELARFLGWKDGRLVFESTPVDEVLQKLERWYNIDIAVDDLPIKGKTMTASFQNESMTEVLNILAISLNAKYKKSDRKIILTKKQT